MPHYFIDVEAAVDSGVQGRFPTLVADVMPGGTRLHGPLADQTALLGVLGALDLLGLRISAASLLAVDIPADHSAVHRGR